MLHSKRIIREIEKGNSAVAETIIDTYYDDIYKFLYRKSGTQIDAEDLTQEVFLKFLINISRYNECGKIRNYLFKLAVNVANDYFRKKKNNLVSLEGDYINNIHAEAHTMLDNVIQRHDMKTVFTALHQLPEFQSTVIILRFYHELSFIEIARIMDCSISTAKSRYRQGMKKLKKEMEDFYDER